ncbi:von Willebrand factor type A domain protein [Botrimarina colliarenosi]|uniref:von Willebrand factor type A domain protein n=1 Tax=Botrimarina colliarenosi TaxID=2528001 RepID=A0A5C6AKC0_9BACT|nr:VWA domain-containing protein [Botrimarina colliarenosi]TWT99615.1 von Willebrand factor type A domain protein [Botrimarina colliarenosi]
MSLPVQRRPLIRRRDRRGAILVLIAVLMPVFVIMAAFAIDLAWMQLVRTELRTATDSSSRAGAKTLSFRQSEAAALAAAIDAASRNRVAGTPLQLARNDVSFGQSTQANSDARFVFATGGSPSNAVRVQGRRDAGSASGSVNLFFGSVLGTRTFQPVLSATSTVLDRDICLVIDRSGSMGLNINFSGTGNGINCGPLPSNTRFFALAQAVDAFLAELQTTIPDERVALASYSSNFRQNCGRVRLNYRTAQLHNSLTSDYARISGSMDAFLQNGIGGSTAIGEGLREGIDSLRNARPFAVKTIVLMTDGRHNLGVTPETVAPEASRADVTVHTVTFSPNADINRMRAVANATGGRSFHADTAADLAEAFREIARTLPVLVTE